MALFHKSKQYLFAVAKVLVVSITFGYLYFRLQKYATQDVLAFLKPMLSNKASMLWAISFAIFLTIGNWLLEAFKWKVLVCTFQKIDFKTALEQTLTALTVSLATPSRIGDYGAKVLFFEKDQRKKILLLNFFSNAAQLFATVFFGLIGLAFLLGNYDIPYSKSAVLVMGIGGIILVVIGYLFRNKQLFVKGFSVINTIHFFKKLTIAVKLNVLFLSFFRYLIFSGMFYFFLIFFGAETAFYPAIMLIFASYLLVSILPSIFIFDVVIRGGIALWLFSFVGVSEFVVLTTVLFMWLCNFVIPSIVGSVYVIRFQPAVR